MEEKTLTFEEKLEKLLELARKKKNVLEQKEIIDFFHGEILSPEQLDQIDEYLENNKVDVLAPDEDLEIDPELFLEEEDLEEEEIDVDPSGAVHAGGRQYRGSGPHVFKRDWKGASFDAGGGD